MGEKRIFIAIAIVAAATLSAYLLFGNSPLTANFHDTEIAQVEPVQIIDVPGDFASIQDAIDSAPPYSLIRIDEGTYQESITISKSISIEGSGANSTIIQSSDIPQYQGRYSDTFVAVGIINSDQKAIEVTFQDLAVISYEIEDASSNNRTVAVYIDGAVDVVFQNTSLVGDKYAIRVSSSSSGSKLNFNESEISSNEVGISMDGNSNCYNPERYLVELNIDSSAFIQRQDIGSSLYQYDVCGSKTNISNSTFKGALVFWVEADATISDSEFSEKGTIVVYGARVTIADSTISSNSLHGIRVNPYNWGKSVLDLRDSTISNNKGYGLVVSGSECFDDEDLYPALSSYNLDDVEISGWNNRIDGNKEGDICPPEYPIPSTFLGEG